MLRIRKDKKKCVQYFFSVLFVLFAFCFTSFIINQENNVFAVSDYFYVWDWDTHSSYYLCGENSGRACSDYSYVIFEPSGICTDNAASFYVAGVGSFSGNSLISVCSKIIAPINSPVLMLTGARYLADRYSGDITITLTDSLSGSAPSGSITLSENGTYDVTSYAEAVVDVPAQTLPGDYDDEFNGVIIAIYTCGAIVIMIYFFYIIYGIIIKPTGGSK